MAKKNEITRKILSKLKKRQAVKTKDLKSESYAMSRSLKNLVDTGLVETLETDQESYARITQKGRQQLTRINLDQKNTLANMSWDGKWRIIMLDLPEERKTERESLRYLLKKAGFVCIKNSVWVSPFPFEFLFQNIKKDFNLTTELMIFVTDEIDEETRKVLVQKFT